MKFVPRGGFPWWALALCCTALVAQADVVFDMVDIGNAGNRADTTGHGSVGYEYRIGRYEVTVAQYTEFLNAVAASDPYGLYRDSMGQSGGPGNPFITRSGEAGSYIYAAVAGKENEPVRWVSLYDGMRFCNWLANGQGSGDTETGSYTLSLGVFTPRNAGATWAISSQDEWYKAAYYDAEHDAYRLYPNGSDAEPAEPTDGTTPREMNFGGLPYWAPEGTWEYFTSIGETTGHSPYGVCDMGGNVDEWTDTADAYPYDFLRITRGGAFNEDGSALSSGQSSIYEPDTEGAGFGFRVAYIVPEPNTLALLVVGSLAAVFEWGRRRRR